jgi:hypothetical protein
MKFFTPELYLRYNSPDDAEADRAEEEWERKIREYKSFLVDHSKEMNDRVRSLAESLNLHDAELLSLQEDLPTPSPTPFLFPIPIPVATISVKNNGSLTNIIYFLWKEIGESKPLDDWPFSRLRTHWLYDEIAFERRHHYPPLFWQPHLPLYWHRILLSDSRVISIPLFDVVVQAFAEQSPETAILTKRRA